MSNLCHMESYISRNRLKVSWSVLALGLKLYDFLFVEWEGRLDTSKLFGNCPDQVIGYAKSWTVYTIKGILSCFSKLVCWWVNVLIFITNLIRYITGATKSRKSFFSLKVLENLNFENNIKNSKLFFK
jgi:hypothetical protein